MQHSAALATAAASSTAAEVLPAVQQLQQVALSLKLRVSNLMQGLARPGSPAVAAVQPPPRAMLWPDMATTAASPVTDGMPSEDPALAGGGALADSAFMPPALLGVRTNVAL